MCVAACDPSFPPVLIHPVGQPARVGLAHDTITADSTPMSTCSYALLVVVISGLEQDDARCSEIFSTKPETPTWPPPREMPPHLRDQYTMNGSALVADWYPSLAQQNGGGQNWQVGLVKYQIDVCRHVPETNRGQLYGEYKGKHVQCHCCCYSTFVCFDALRAFQEQVAGSRAIVLGSQSPWAEAMLLSLGASHVLTIEWSSTTLQTNSSAVAKTRQESMVLQRPELQGLDEQSLLRDLSRRWAWQHPTDVARSYLDHSWTPVDVAFSFSSLEHDGLGRYGDPLNPDGDLLTIAKVACLLRPGGLFFLGFAVGRDAVVWNAHRIYGSSRLQLVFKGWHLLTFFGTADTHNGKGGSTSNTKPRKWPDQPVFVLQKPLSAAGAASRQRRQAGRGPGVGERRKVRGA